VPRTLARLRFVPADGLSEILVFGIPGMAYAVDYSTDLLSGQWEEVATFSLGPDELSTTIQLPQRGDRLLFIRIREMTPP